MPFRGSTRGESEHSATWDAVGGLHPLHWELHSSPSGEERQVMVVVSSQECQDIGAFQIGLGSVLLLAVVFPGAAALAIALLGTGIGAGAHVVSHVVGRDLGGRPGVDIPVFAVLAALLVGAGVFSWLTSSERGRAGQ